MWMLFSFTILMMYPDDELRAELVLAAQLVSRLLPHFVWMSVLWRNVRVQGTSHGHHHLHHRPRLQSVVGTCLYSPPTQAQTLTPTTPQQNKKSINTNLNWKYPKLARASFHKYCWICIFINSKLQNMALITFNSSQHGQQRVNRYRNKPRHNINISNLFTLFIVHKRK